jgi:hypothetical protein
MNPESLFSFCSLVVVPGWLLLIVAPRWKVTHWVIGYAILPLVLALVYLGLILAQFRGAEGGFGSLAEVRQLFANPYLLLAGWVHYLAFDLFVGSWEARDARRLGIPHLLLIPCLVLTFLFGPIGLLAYCVLRAALKKTLAVTG